MKPLTLVLVLVIAFLSVCCRGAIPRPADAPYAEPGAILSLHGDTAFTPRERGLINQAILNLEGETKGFFIVTVIYDVDFDNLNSIETHAADDLLLKVSSTDPFVQQLDSVNGLLLGLKFFDAQRGGATTVLLVADRLEDDRLLISVAMHEILHAFGIPHVEGFINLMSPSEGYGPPPVCLHESDVKAICDEYGCDVNRIGYCTHN